MIKSPLRWVGSKAKLVDRLIPLVPQHKNYFEPFFGSGVLALNIPDSHRTGKIFAGDICIDLITTWRIIRDHPQTFISLLSEMGQGEDYYYKIRDTDAEGHVDAALRFYYLNQTCFNGLYRVNKKGKFNVPWGKREFKLRPDVILEASQKFKSAAFYSGGYNSPHFEVSKGDFVYLDPPYVQAGKSFVGYSPEGLPNTESLLEYCHDLTNMGVMFMMSNSNTPEVRKLWKYYDITEVMTTRSVSADPSKRGQVKELIIRNY